MKDKTIQTVYQKVHGMIENSIANLGSIFLMEYRLPTTHGLEQFLNSLKITLWRMALAPQYVWWIGADGCCNLALSIYGGYGRKDVSDIDSIVQRLWHGGYPLALHHWQWVDGGNAQCLLNSLRSFVSTESNLSLPHHKRSFGGTIR